MNGERISVRYVAPGMSYVTETFTDTTPMTAVSMIKARAGADVKIDRIEYHPPPPAPWEKPSR